MAFMNVFRRFLFAAAAVALTVALVGPAHAARPNGYPITNVNLRAGPGTDYPVILTVPSRAPISIRGCLPDYTWCDVVFEQNRGWMRSIYLAGWLGGQYYLLRHYAPQLRYPVVSFEIGSYWDSYYRDRPFYGERPRWSRPRGEGWIDRGIFYNRLAPYGQWVWLQGQYVWVPTRVGPSWRPYTYGRWVYTERYGWMWASDEPWGWATYHYGRWGFSNRIGWFWVPGNRWGPAWVSWRSSGDYLAWAPLPPAHDEGLSIEISIGNVPDYYWQVVPAGAFLSVNLSQVIVRDRARIRPVIEHARPLGNVTVVNNVVVNKLVNVKYVEEKTKKKVVVHKVERTKDAAKAGKVEGDVVEVFEPVAGQEPEAAAPPEPKKIEEVAAESKTKEQAGGEPSTEELLVPPAVKEAMKDEAAPPAPPPLVAPKEDEPAPADEVAPPPPPTAEMPAEAPSSDTGAPPPPAEESKPAKSEDNAPAPKEPEQAAPAHLPAAPPAPAGEEAPPPASERTPPPPAPEEAPPEPPAPEEAAPATEPKAAEPKADGGPKAKKGKGERPKKQPAMEQEAHQPPAPPAEETAPPSPAEDMGAPKAKKDGKPKKDKPQRAQPSDQRPPEAADAPPPEGKKGKKGPKPAQQGSPCPEGSLTLDDGSCVPAE